MFQQLELQAALIAWLHPPASQLRKQHATARVAYQGMGVGNQPPPPQPEQQVAQASSLITHDLSRQGQLWMQRQVRRAKRQQGGPSNTICCAHPLGALAFLLNDVPFRMVRLNDVLILVMRLLLSGNTSRGVRSHFRQWRAVWAAALQANWARTCVDATHAVSLVPLQAAQKRNRSCHSGPSTWQVSVLAARLVQLTWHHGDGSNVPSNRVRRSCVPVSAEGGRLHSRPDTAGARREAPPEP